MRTTIMASNWRYVVVFASFMVQFITAGMQYSAGVYHIIFTDLYGKDHLETSIVGGLLLGISVFTAILGNFIAQRLGCRVTVMSGGLIAAIGFGLSFLCEELFEIYICIGILGGLGLGLAFTPSIIIVEQYFPKHRSMALGVSTCGLGLGISLWPLGVQFVDNELHWKGASLLISGVALNICLMGALMRPPEGYKVKPLPMFKPSVLKIPMFIILCASYLLWSLGATLIYIHMPNYCKSLGQESSDCAKLVCYIGMAVFVSRGMFRLINDVDIFTTTICTIIIGAVFTGLWRDMFEKYTGIIGYCLMFGFHSGFWASFNHHVAKDSIGLENVAQGYGYFTLLAGVGTIMGAVLGGWFIKETNNYDYIFYTAGICVLVSSSLLVGTKLFQFLPRKALHHDHMEKHDSPVHIDRENLLVESMITTL